MTAVTGQIGYTGKTVLKIAIDGSYYEVRGYAVGRAESIYFLTFRDGRFLRTTRPPFYGSCLVPPSVAGGDYLLDRARNYLEFGDDLLRVTDSPPEGPDIDNPASNPILVAIAIPLAVVLSPIAIPIRLITFNAAERTVGDVPFGKRRSDVESALGSPLVTTRTQAGIWARYRGWFHNDSQPEFIIVLYRDDYAVAAFSDNWIDDELGTKR